jgi:hypothetical protein
LSGQSLVEVNLVDEQKVIIIIIIIIIVIVLVYSGVPRNGLENVIWL